MRRLVWPLLLVCAWFNTASAASPISIFGNVVPSIAAEADSNAVTLGVKFQSTQAGTISGIRFYRGAKNRAGYTARLYSASGQVLATSTLVSDSCAVPCWEQANFASPVSVAANTTYVASYYTSNGHYADGYYGLTSGVSNGPLSAPASASVGGNGVYLYGKGFPNQSWEDSNYYVDVAFTPAAAPTLMLSFTPPNPSIPSNAPAGTVVAKITAAWSDGSPFTGTLGFGSPYSNDNGTFAISGNNLVVNGTGLASDANTNQEVTVTATQAPATMFQNILIAVTAAQAIAGISLSGSNFTGGAPSGTVVGAVSVAMSSAPPPFSGTLTLTGADASSFQLAGSNLETNGVVPSGSYHINIVATQAGVNGSPFSQPETITGSGSGGGPVTISLLGSATPATVDSADTNSVELGMIFNSSASGGKITGCRFYKATTNTGTHICNLWTTAGTNLARVTVTGETASGWQQMNFASPVSVSPNTNYVISYFAPVGHYSNTEPGFTNPVTFGPLTAPANASVSPGNGVFSYSGATTFPTQTFGATDYWVDVLYNYTPPPQIPTAIAFSPGSPVRVSDTTTTSQTIATVNVTTNDGTAFPSADLSLTANAGGRVTLTGNSIVPAHNFSSADDGTSTVMVQATENGTSISQSLSLIVAGNPTAGVLPTYADASSNWANAGLQTVGGIAATESGYTQCGSTVTPGGGDDASAIRAAIAACTPGHYVLLSGALKIHIADEPISLVNSSNQAIVVRGSGTCNNASSPYCPTSITVTDGTLAYTAGPGGGPGCGTSGSPVDCPNGGPPAVYLGPVEPSAGSVGWGVVALAADAAQGQSTVQVASTANFSAGQIVFLDELTGAGWGPDPMSAVSGNTQIYASPEFLNNNGSPAVARAAWSKYRTAGGVESGDEANVDPNANGTPGCWFTGATRCGAITNEFHKISSVGPGPCPGASCTISFDDPLTIGYRQSAGHNAKVYYPEVALCNGCAFNPAPNMVVKAGLENISILRAPNTGVTMTYCTLCWIKNVEVSHWNGGGIDAAYTFRSEINGALVQFCDWCTNNGGEYGYNIDSGTTELLFTNSISRFDGKSMVARAAGAGSVVSYNYFDQTYYVEGISDTWVEMSANASHYIGPHHVLFEGNWAFNLDNDNTHGSSGYLTYFRNQSTGFRSSFVDASNSTTVNDVNHLPGGNGPFRAAGMMTYNYWISFVGNVLGTPTKTTTGNGWVYQSTCGWCNFSIFQLGWNTGPGGADPYLDGISGSYLFRHGNYDYLNTAVTWDPGTPDHTLPDSFYLVGAPSFFSPGTSCTYTWPWVTPSGTSQIQTNSCSGSGLPAKARADAGTPFVQP